MQKPEYWESEELWDSYFMWVSKNKEEKEQKSKLAVLIEELRNPPINEQVDFLNKINALLYTKDNKK